MSEEKRKDYFKNMKSSLQAKLVDEEIFDWKDFPTLASLEKNELLVPDGYFENSKRHLHRSSPKSNIRIFSMFKYAAVLILPLAFFIWSQLQEPTIEILPIAAVNDFESIEYLAEDDWLSEDDFLIFEDTDEITLFKDLDTEDIIEYISNESDIYDLEHLPIF